MNYNIKDINEQIDNDVQGFVDACEKRYQKQIIKCVEQIASNESKKDYKFILLAGPSSAGKTTTSHLFKENLKTHGFNAKVVSIDNFFLERIETPKLPNGNYDYESLRAIDWNLFHGTITRWCTLESMPSSENRMPGNVNLCLTCLCCCAACWRLCSALRCFTARRRQRPSGTARRLQASD